MARLSFITDQHYDARNDLDETVRVHNWIAEDARARGCQATLLGGDLLDGPSRPSDHNAVATWLRLLADFGEVVAVDGNHEADGDTEIFSHLRARYPITFYGQPGVHVLAALNVAVACLPWPHLGRLLANLDNASAEETQAAAHEAMRGIILGLGAGLDAHPNFARIGLAHASVTGAKTDHDQPLRGSEFKLSAGDLVPMRAGIVLLGHIHAHQALRVGDADAVYGGSTESCNFGEPTRKSYLVVETDGPRIVGYERVFTPTAPMILAEGVFDGSSMSNSYALRGVEGADIRFQYRVGLDQRAAGRAAAEDLKRELLERGARSVTLDPVVETETRARAPEVALAKGHREKLEAHWKHKAFEPGPRRDGLLNKADFLHEATREA